VGDDLLGRAHGLLLDQRSAGGYWEGHLSSSALSTATAVAALALHARESPGAADRDDPPLIANGIQWLLANRNRDGGWGDTIASESNISTTMLAWAALAFVPPDVAVAAGVTRDAEAWLVRTAGGLNPARLAAAVETRYGRDRTFSVPILTMCALAGRLGPESQAWRYVPALPFELAAAPRRFFATLRLPVVSYALPALIAMGLARHRRSPSRNFVACGIRNVTTPRVLRVLDILQPADGGFLEATPLTSFVAMSLVGAGECRHVVVDRALRFIRASVRADGSWPIDTHLATWVTTLAVNALDAAGTLARLDAVSLSGLTRWLVAQQHGDDHVYTGAAPGGWAWTPLAGGVPDADDTAGALVALSALPRTDETSRAAVAGIEWLLGLQNRDGGIPTFCRGWGALPFDRSGADLTAHALRAWHAWHDALAPALQARVARATARALAYLRVHQDHDGAFVPLWFGNEAAADQANRTYGTARVVMALASLRQQNIPGIDAMIAAAVSWLLGVQNDDGGWGGEREVPSSIEETSLAVGALAACCDGPVNADVLRSAIVVGSRWLNARTDRGQRFPATPIGLYFAKLWYSESLYPLIFLIEGIGRASRSGILANAHVD
jgi:squalene-hopene/tetraprenyl-beta-curcumene cyclase